MILFYIRHGDPIYHPDSLTPLGQRQAEAVAKRLAAHGIDQIFASTSNRALLTAIPTSELTKKKIIQLDFCNEGHAWEDFGLYDTDGKQRWIFNNSIFRKRFASREVFNLGEKWYEHPDFAEYPLQQAIERIHTESDKFLLSLGYEHVREEGIYRPVAPNDERVALFAHQGFGLCFLSSILDIPYPQFSQRFDIGHTGVTVIEFKETQGFVIPKILTMSNDSHIYREGLPTQYYSGIYF